MSREQTRRRFLGSAGLAGAVALAGCGGPGGSGSGGGNRQVTILYGDKNRAVAQTIKSLVDANALEVTVTLRKGGSDIENLRRVGNANVAFALVGSDVAFFANNGTVLEAFRASPLDDLRGVTSLYPMPVVAVTRPGLDVELVSDLSEHTVNTGEVGTAMEVNSLRVLDAAGASGYDAAHLPLSDATSRVANGELDATFATGDWPVPALSSLTDSADVRVLELSEASRQSIPQNANWLVPARLPAAVYEGVDYAVDTVAVTNLLVTHKRLSEGIVTRVISAVLENADRFETRGHFISKSRAERGMSLELHDGANDYINF